MMTVTTVFAKDNWNCKTVDGTVDVIQTSGCSETRICVGYAQCSYDNGKTALIKMTCLADPSFNCPEANECIDQLLSNKVTIATNSERSSRGLFRFCPSSTGLGKPRDSKVDVSNAKFCDILNNSYDLRIGPAWTIDRMTDRAR